VPSIDTNWSLRFAVTLLIPKFCQSRMTCMDMADPARTTQFVERLLDVTNARLASHRHRENGLEYRNCHGVYVQWI